MDSNEDVRVRAQCEGINFPVPVAAQSQRHERKPIWTRDGGDDVSVVDPGGGGDGDRCATKVKEDNCPDLTQEPSDDDTCEIIEEYIDPNSSSDTPGRVV